MPEVNEYEVQGGFRLSELGKVFKLSLGRMIIFMIIAAILAGILSAVYVPVSANAAQKVSTVIDLGFQGIEEGKDPYGMTFNPNSIISPNIVLKSTKRTFNGDESKKNDLQSNLRIDEVKPDEYLKKLNALIAQLEKDPTVQNEINSLKYYPNRFVISLNNYKKIGLTKNQAIDFVNNVVEEYLSDFKAKYILNPINILVDKTINYEEYDYIERYDIFYNQLTLIISDLDALLAKSSVAAGYESPTQGAKISQYRDRFATLLNSNLRAYEVFVLSNGVTRNISNTLMYMVSEYNNNLLMIKQNYALATNTYNMILTYKHSTSLIMGSGTTPIEQIIPSEAYDNLFVSLANYRSSAERYRTRCAQIELQIKQFKGADGIQLDPIPVAPDFKDTSSVSAVISPELSVTAYKELSYIPDTSVSEVALTEEEAQREADERTANLKNKFLEAIENVELFIAEFNEKTLYTEAITQSTRAYDATDISSTIKNAVIVGIIIVALAVVVAYLTTFFIYLDKRKQSEKEMAKKSESRVQ